MRHLASASSKPVARLRLLIGSQRKLFLLVFLWTCLCFMLFRTARRAGPSEDGPEGDSIGGAGGGLHHQQARSAASVRPVLSSMAAGSSEQSLFALEILAPEFDLPTRPMISTAANSGSDQQAKRHHYELVELLGDEQREGAEDKKVSRPEAVAKAVAVPVEPASEKKTTSARTKTSPSQQQQQRQQVPVAGDQCHYDYPNLFDLQFNNIHWQKFTSNAREFNLTSDNLKPATFYLYNAYYDDRWRAGQPSVRVLAMIDRIHPPPVNCLLWSSQLNNNEEGSSSPTSGRPTGEKRPLVTRAQFVYAWYPKWGNYEDGLLQPWIVTCPVPRGHARLVPESVSLVDVPVEMDEGEPGAASERDKRDLSDLDSAAVAAAASDLASMPVPPSFSSSSSSSSSINYASSSSAQSVGEAQLSVQSPASRSTTASSGGHSGSGPAAATASELSAPSARQYDCNSVGQPITNNLPVFNRRPQPGAKREKFAVCVKGLDFPYDSEHVSIRLVEWIELLNLLGAKKIFLYELDVHENISKVLQYYQKRGIVELSPLTLPGDQPNLPEYQHIYLKQKLTSKRQNELLPYNDCLYRNLHSYQYLALLDIDEIIMPLRGEHNNWHDLMEEVERVSLAEQNYSRASYNVRNVYFFDDLSGPLGTTQSSRPSSTTGASSSTDEDSVADGRQPISERAGGQTGQSSSKHGRHDSAERGIPHYLHMMSHVYRSKNYTEPGQYVKCFHNTERVISLHNHFPMNCFGQCTTYSIPVDLAHLQHYRKDCVGPLKQSCKNDFRLFTTRDTTIWKYKQRMIRRTTRALSHLGLLANYNGNSNHDGGHQRQVSVRSS